MATTLLQSDAPHYGEDGMDVDEDDVQEEDQSWRADLSASKRRRVNAFDEQEEERAELVAAFDLSKGKRKLESQYTRPGQQMSVFQAMQRRAMGFKAGSAQGACELVCR